MKGMNSVESFLSTYDELMRQNAVLAEENLKYESEISESQAALEVKKAEFQKVRESLSVKEAEQQKILAQFQPRVLIEKVTAAAAEADEASEALAYEFTQGSLPVEEFIPAYMKCRKLYHLRSSKVARLNA